MALKKAVIARAPRKRHPRTTKRVYRRRRFSSMNNTKRNLYNQLFPRSRTFFHEYTTTCSVTVPSLQNSYSNYFRMGNLYDPDGTNIGKNQPASGYTALSTYYNAYAVEYVDVKITAVDSSPSAPGLHVSTVVTQTGSNYGTSARITDIAQYDTAKSVITLPNTNNRAVIKRRIYPYKSVGCSKKEYMGNKGLFAIGSTTLGPDTDTPVPVNMYLSTGSLDETNLPGCVTYYLIEMKYKVRWSRRNSTLTTTG